VLELGSGVGVVGMAAAALGADVVMTDLPYVMPQLQNNIGTTQAAWENLGSAGGTMTARSLDWKNWEANPISHAPFDLIVGADIVWLEKLISPLCQLLIHLAHTSKCNILIAHQTRSKRADDMLFEELAKDFEVSALSLDDFPDTGQLKMMELVPRLA
jgi:predicted nicotinamide N-methyase